MTKPGPSNEADEWRASDGGARLLGAHWGLYAHERRGGGLVPLAGDPDPALFGAELPADRLAPSRILRPAIRRSFLDGDRAARTGRRGADPFVETTWEEALDLVASEIETVRNTHGNGAIYSGSYGWSSAGRFHHAQSQLKRFFNTVGGSVRSHQTYSYAAGEVVLPHVIGSTDGLVARHTPWDAIAGHAELVVMFGGMPLRNSQVGAGGIARHRVRDELEACRGRGADFVNVGPVRADAPDGLDAEWVSLRPNTDTALMLALCHELVSTDRHDSRFVESHTTGFEQLRAYLFGEEDGIAKDRHWASPICALAPSAIADLALRMASCRTLLTVAWSLQRAEHGEQACWAAIALASLLGGIGLPGGGIGFGYASIGGIGRPAPSFAFPSLPQGTNPVSEAIPVARVADMLLFPGAPYDFDGEQRRFPAIDMIYWAGGNPFHHHQDLNRLVEAWQRPRTIVVHEHWWNAHARHADIVLPAATFMEREDIVVSGRESFIAWSRPIAPPPEGMPSDHAIFRGLAARLGAEVAFTEGLDEADWIERLYATARASAGKAGLSLPDFETLKQVGLIELPETSAEPLMASFRADPVAAPLPTPSGRIELFSARVAGFHYDDCPGRPNWREPLEWLGSKEAERFPLHLLTCQPHDKLHSQWDHAAPSRSTKKAGRQPVRIHPEDAGHRAIRDGQIVEVWNDRGRCLAVAQFDDGLHPGVVQMATGAWFDPVAPQQPGSLELNGNPNVLTADRGTSRLSQGPSVNSCLVEIAVHSGPAPRVRAYRGADLVSRKIGKTR